MKGNLAEITEHHFIEQEYLLVLNDAPKPSTNHSLPEMIISFP